MHTITPENSLPMMLVYNINAQFPVAGSQEEKNYRQRFINFELKESQQEDYVYIRAVCSPPQGWRPISQDDFLKQFLTFRSSFYTGLHWKMEGFTGHLFVDADGSGIAVGTVPTPDSDYKIQCFTFGGTNDPK